ncbi:hypothetical protein GCM10027188_29630 [Lysobacter humi (ex Lee et al. 2017)]
MKLPSLVSALALALTGCMSARAPSWAGHAWSGQEPGKLVAELRSSRELPAEGWLVRAEPANADGSFAYRKQSPSFRYADRGYFSIERGWRPDQNYIGLLSPERGFCVVNPEMQGEVSGGTVITYRVYDYCAVLRSP